ncbi:hypothetical protein Zm00014a_016695 [Zea mays]|uniref:Uncharacterized protein n=1 Tax=Zea mays TaxID=4577 RepID=A0A3L6GA81_MAIZE|nr:hypothetical protein Zm00014a_016695 [Zea mays]
MEEEDARHNYLKAQGQGPRGASTGYPHDPTRWFMAEFAARKSAMPFARLRLTLGWGKWSLTQGTQRSATRGAVGNAGPARR